jgi:hypothetical protein
MLIILVFKDLKFFRTKTALLIINFIAWNVKRY